MGPLKCRLFRQSALECGWRDRQRPPLQKPFPAPGRAADAQKRVPTTKSLHLRGAWADQTTGGVEVIRAEVLFTQGERLLVQLVGGGEVAALQVLLRFVVQTLSVSCVPGE